MSTRLQVEKLNTIFKEFCHQHDTVNRFLRSTEVCYRFTRMHVDPRDEADLVRSLFPARWKRYDSLKNYRGRFEETERRNQATLQDLKGDMSEGWDIILEAVVVKEVSAFEQFVRDWTLAAAMLQIQDQNTKLPAKQKTLLSKLVNDLTANPRLSITLSRLAEYFPALITLLESTTHKRAIHPILSASRIGISCLDAAQMWREVRNLILHHNRIVHNDFYRRWSPIWGNITTDAKQSGRRIAIRPAMLGKRLPLVLRHTIFCLTTCYQAAVVFHIAASGEEP